ncbi:ABC transporter permease [Glaciibacter sp. 2TAF33]|uniref:ABC transporter permease n=1 Tax=Glaciibacter sp. 2TAF33 TaxID=3233015 RepID=UPI003F93AD1A
MKPVVSRMVHLIIVLFGISVLTFLLIRLLPGDPALALAAQSGNADPQLIAEIRKDLGLDLPAWQQYGNWIVKILQGNFGVSYVNNQPVSSGILNNLPVTIHLMVMAQVFSLVVAVPVALYVAARRDRGVDRAVTAINFAMQAIPNYVLAMVGISVFAVALGWLPAVGYVPLQEGVWASTVSLIIPTLAVSALLIAVYTRVLRESVIDSLRMDYVLVGRSLGYSRRELLWNSALKPSLPPLITVAGLHVGVLLGGAVVVEVICGLPGLGTLLVHAINSRDYTTVQALVLLFAVAFVVVNFITDLIHMAIDPRVRVTA